MSFSVRALLVPLCALLLGGCASRPVSLPLCPAHLALMQLPPSVRAESLNRVLHGDDVKVSADVQATDRQQLATAVQAEMQQAFVQVGLSAPQIVSLSEPVDIVDRAGNADRASNTDGAVGTARVGSTVQLDSNAQSNSAVQINGTAQAANSTVQANSTAQSNDTAQANSAALQNNNNPTSIGVTSTPTASTEVNNTDPKNTPTLDADISNKQGLNAATLATLQARHPADLYVRFIVTDYGETPERWKTAYISFEVVSTLAIAGALALHKVTRPLAGIYLIEESAEELSEGYAGFWLLNRLSRPVRMEAEFIDGRSGAVLGQYAANGLTGWHWQHVWRMDDATRDDLLAQSTHKAAKAVAHSLRDFLAVHAGPWNACGAAAVGH